MFFRTLQTGGLAAQNHVPEDLGSQTDSCKVTVFRDITSHTLVGVCTDISEELGASFIRGQE
jgi:hypothetical protein